MSTPIPGHNVTPIPGDGGGGGGGSSNCDQLARDLQSLESSLALFQNKLNTTSGPDGPGTELNAKGSETALISLPVKSARPKRHS
jgi:hypothetical protein